MYINMPSAFKGLKEMEPTLVIATSAVHGRCQWQIWVGGGGLLIMPTMWDIMIWLPKNYNNMNNNNNFFWGGGAYDLAVCMWDNANLDKKKTHYWRDNLESGLVQKGGIFHGLERDMGHYSKDAHGWIIYQVAKVPDPWQITVLPLLFISSRFWGRFKAQSHKGKSLTHSGLSCRKRTFKQEHQRGIAMVCPTEKVVTTRCVTKEWVSGGFGDTRPTTVRLVSEYQGALETHDQLQCI